MPLNASFSSHFFLFYLIAAQWIADSLPDWLAPNTITLIGLLCSLAACILTLVFNPSLGPEGPRWLHLLVGVSLFVYQTLDNVDGIKSFTIIEPYNLNLSLP